MRYDKENRPEYHIKIKGNIYKDPQCELNVVHFNQRKNTKLKMENNINNLKTIVVSRDKLLEALKSNKAKHDEALEASKIAYWEAAKKWQDSRESKFNEFVERLSEEIKKSNEKIAKKITEKKEALCYEDFFLKVTNFNHSFDGNFPVDYSNYYNSTIRKVEMSVYENISLQQDEFEKYVMNNWEWKENFVTNFKMLRTSAYGGAQGPQGAVGAAGSVGIGTSSPSSNIYLSSADEIDKF